MADEHRPQQRPDERSDEARKKYVQAARERRWTNEQLQNLLHPRERWGNIGVKIIDDDHPQLWTNQIITAATRPDYWPQGEKPDAEPLPARVICLESEYASGTYFLPGKTGSNTLAFDDELYTHRATPINVGDLLTILEQLPRDFPLELDAAEEPGAGTYIPLYITGVEVREDKTTELVLIARTPPYEFELEYYPADKNVG